MYADLGGLRLTWRRLRVLLERLPRESAFVREVAGPVARWGETEHLLAVIADTVRTGVWQTSVLNRKKNTSAPKAPEPLPRPGGRSKPKALRPSEVARMMKGGGTNAN